MPTGSPVRMRLTKTQREKLATLGQRYLKSADPTVNNDSGEGYGVWDKWLNQTSGEAYVCTDATEGAAVWQNISLDADDLSALFDAKADKDTDAVVGNLYQAVAGGGYEDSGIAPADKADVTEVNALINPRQISQAINMTYAASGSNGIKILNDDNMDMGTGDFTLVWDGIVFDYTQDPVFWFTVNSNYFIFGILESGGEYFFYFRIRVGVNNNYRTATVPISLANGNGVKLVASYQRESASSDGLLAFYVDSLLHEAITVSAQEPPSVVTGGSWYVSGSSLERRASTTQSAILYNRALSADDVAYLYKNGIDPADMWGSQTALTSGTLEIGKNYIIDTFETGDDFTNVGAASNEDGVEFTATDTAPTTWTNGSSLRNTGATAAYLPENIQPVPGQWLDASSNKLHALMPAAGCTLMRPENEFEIRWTNTWAGTSEMQYIGGTNQAILPEGNIRIEYITLTCTATGVSITIGDGSDADRFVTSTALADYLDISSPTKRNHDGTNRDMTITPSGTYTGSITTTVVGKILG